MKNYSQLTVNLIQKEDKNGKVYFVGHIMKDELPIKDPSIDLSDGVVFMIWPHLRESRDPAQMVIKRMSKSNDTLRNNVEEDYDYDDDGEVGGGKAWANGR